MFCLLINSAPKELRLRRFKDSYESEVIEGLIKGGLIRLGLYFEALKELCIRYENTPYLKKLPAQKKIVTLLERGKVHPVFKENYVLSIALETETSEIDLLKKHGEDYPITLFYIESTTEKFDMEHLFIILRFNCSHAELSPQREKLSLKVTLTSVDSDTQYQGNIPVSFKVLHF